MEAEKQKIIEFLEGKTGKSKFYFTDLCKVFPDMKQREVKKILTALVQDGKLMYWSSGSTTLYGLAGVGKQAAEEE